MSIWTVALQPLVVLIEIINLFDSFKLSLKTVLNVSWKASKVLVEGLTHIIKVSLELSFDHVADREENHRNVEA